MRQLMHFVLASTTSIEQSKLFTGTKALITDATTALMIILPIAAVLLLLYCFFKKASADEMDQKKWEIRIKTIAVSTAGGFLASVFVNIIAHYYKG